MLFVPGCLYPEPDEELRVIPGPDEELSSKRCN